MHVRHLILAAVVAISFSAGDVHSQPLAVCVAAAKDQLELFGVDDRIMESRCKCVQSRRNGQLPTSLADWEITGKNRPILTLIECSKSDIYNFYKTATFTSAKSRLERAGKSVESINEFSACVANGALQEIRRAAASENGRPGELDKAAFRRMYSQCESDIN
jgi:hypothetical protein